jgi:dienelactone hydrolase
MLAELGYVAIALDMYGDGQQASHPKDAGKFSSAIASNLDNAEQRFMAAYQLLQLHPLTQKDKMAAIGYCFGGGIVLAMARRGVNLKGVASFHGSLGLGAPVEKGKVKAQILVLNGEADPFVKTEQIESFKKEMGEAGVNYEFINYPNAKHAFTNPGADKYGKQFSIPLAYNQKADKASWAKLQTFLKQIFE